MKTCSARCGDHAVDVANVTAFRRTRARKLLDDVAIEYGA